jgi:hypothetical protein
MAATSSKSKLTPYAEQIAEWQNQGHSFGKIAELLASEHNVKVAVSTLFEFAKTLAPQSAEASPPPPQDERLHRIEVLLEQLVARDVLNPIQLKADPEAQAQLQRIETGIAKLLQKPTSTTPPPTPPPAADYRQELSELLTKVGELSNQIGKTPQASAVPPPPQPGRTQVGRIWLRAILLTSLFWLVLWFLFH